MSKVSEWGQRVIELEGMGLRVVEIAEAMGVSSGMVCDLKSGRRSEPCGMAAVALFKLHRKHCK